MEEVSVGCWVCGHARVGAPGLLALPVAPDRLSSLVAAAPAEHPPLPGPSGGEVAPLLLVALPSS